MLWAERQARRKASEYQTQGLLERTETQSEPVKAEVPESEETDEEQSRNELRREKALRLLERNMRSKTALPEHQVSAAVQLLAKLSKPKQETDLNAWDSRYKGMTDEELAGRLLTCACSILGLQTVKRTLDELERTDQAVLV
jgi:hypothetical protein